MEVLWGILFCGFVYWIYWEAYINMPQQMEAGLKKTGEKTTYIEWYCPLCFFTTERPGYKAIYQNTKKCPACTGDITPAKRIAKVVNHKENWEKVIRAKKGCFHIFIGFIIFLLIVVLL